MRTVTSKSPYACFDVTSDEWVSPELVETVGFSSSTFVPSVAMFTSPPPLKFTYHGPFVLASAHVASGYDSKLSDSSPLAPPAVTGAAAPRPQSADAPRAAPARAKCRLSERICGFPPIGSIDPASVLPGPVPARNPFRVHFA